MVATNKQVLTIFIYGSSSHKALSNVVDDFECLFFAQLTANGDQSVFRMVEISINSHLCAIQRVCNVCVRVIFDFLNEISRQIAETNFNHFFYLFILFFWILFNILCVYLCMYNSECVQYIRCTNQTVMKTREMSKNKNKKNKNLLEKRKNAKRNATYV